MTSGRVVEAHRTFQVHTLDPLSSLMALRYGGLDVGVVLLLHCFHAVSFPSHRTRTRTRASTIPYGTQASAAGFLPMTENRLCTSSVPIFLDG